MQLPIFDTKDRLIAALAAIIITALLVFAWLAHQQNVALAHATELSQAASAKIAALEADRATLSSADAAQQRAAKATEANVKTSADAVRTIIQYVPMPLVQGATVAIAPQTSVIQRSDLTAVEQSKIPDAPAYVLETQDASIAVAKKLVACEATDASLTTCKAELVDSDAQAALLRQKAQTWESAAKGGSKSKRFLKLLKCAAFTGAGAAAGSISGKPMYAGVGAVAGFGACQVLF